MSAWLAWVSRPGTKEVLCHQLMCAMLTPGNATLACATWQGSFVSPMRVGLSARVVLHHSQPRVRRRDARDTAAWKAAAAATRWAAARLEGYRRGPGPQHAAPDEAAG